MILKKSYFRDYTGFELKNYTFYEIPINQLSSENFEISNGVLREIWGLNSQFEITSNYDNPNAFLIKIISYKEDTSPKVTQCMRDRSIRFFLEREKAIQLQYEFRMLLKSLDKN